MGILKVTNTNGLTLDEDGKSGLSGDIDPETLEQILRPGYQREILQQAYINGLIAAYRSGSNLPPAVDVAVRGSAFELVGGSGAYTIIGDIYIVDGLQRITAAKQLLQAGCAPRVKADIHLGTDVAWERKRFLALNLKKTRVASNVILRDYADEHSGLECIRQLCSDPGFALCNRVSWGTYMGNENLVNALVLVKTALRLHAKFGAAHQSELEAVAQTVGKLMDEVGGDTMLNNVVTFFDVLDDAFGVRSVTNRATAIWLKSGFLYALADVISDYPAFWIGKQVRVDKGLRKKIGMFGITDPTVRAMAISAGSSAVRELSRYLVKHINCGKRSQRLVAQDETQIVLGSDIA